ncbi:MAG: dienelactone hydrolase family protein [Polyangiaceae bacterium]|nr:dienelactone hydrolase family protein [Polyangiaceae bacterium]
MLSSDWSSETRRPPRSSATCRWLLLAVLSVPVWLGCSTSSDDDDTSSTGGSATGGSATGGVATGGTATGASATGGVATGGAATGGSTTGGVATGGTATGGSATGGVATGGAATGGSATGGVATGGSATGGTGRGGFGGVGRGGSSSGGSATGGGVGRGGSSSGGSGDGGSSAGGGSGDGGSGGSQGTGSPGCGSANPLKSSTITVDVDGTSRQYILDVPTGYDTDSKYRLVFVWHPLGGHANQVAPGYNGLKSLANNSAVFVAPEGMNGSNGEASGNGWWNVNDTDMKFLQKMWDDITANLCIDLERVFSTGFSFGGMMSYTIGYEFDVFRAVAPCSGKTGVIPYEQTFTGPLPIMAFHGDSDTFVATALGKAFFDQYLDRNQCGTQTKPVDPSPCVEYQDCVAPAIWCEFSGGHNTWSEEPAAIWKFFSQF